MVTIEKQTLKQFIRFLVVGVLNTLVTLIVIFVCKSILEINEWVSNGIGYVAGVINSFLWNKQWVFHSSKKASHEAVKFSIGFLLCYGLQLLVCWSLTKPLGLGLLTWTVYGFTFTGYAVATLIGMVIYTMANFIYNRLFTFK